MNDRILMNDNDLYTELYKIYLKIEIMIDAHYSSHDETDTLKTLIDELYMRLKELRIYLKNTNAEYRKRNPE